ncbi:hypothetical protein KM043_016021 [Ampulex compressa]|nr:hypothetical protein KM043_016021 [Ampulex compressa]
MNLYEPKKKHRVRLKPQCPFPITLGGTNDWNLYTARLTDLGSCIVDSSEIAAVHSMGFFGKASLSRSYPSFGKSRYGAPPIVKERQWERRQEWLKEVRQLSAESLSECEQMYHLDAACNTAEKTEDISSNNTNTDSKKHNEDSQKQLGDGAKDMSDIIEEHTSNICLEDNQEKTPPNIREIEIDQVVLDSPEEDDICIIISREEEKSKENNDVNECQRSKSRDVEEFLNFDDCDLQNNALCLKKNKKSVQGTLLVLPDSESETEDYLKTVKPQIKCEGFPVQEALHLTFEETFFLLYGLGCLQVINFDGSLLDVNDAWLYFCKVEKSFVQKYVVYHYFRSKGWVVKPGLKYGGDFLLYKQGPPFFHASYIVIVEIVGADSLIKDSTRSLQSMTWNKLLGLERLSETAAKEIMFAQVLWPSSISQSMETPALDMLSEFSVRELLWRRWNPKQNRDVICVEDEDEDSY